MWPMSMVDLKTVKSLTPTNALVAISLFLVSAMFVIFWTDARGSRLEAAEHYRKTNEVIQKRDLEEKQVLANQLEAIVKADITIALLQELCVDGAKTQDQVHNCMAAGKAK